MIDPFKPKAKRPKNFSGTWNGQLAPQQVSSMIDLNNIKNVTPMQRQDFGARPETPELQPFQDVPSVSVVGYQDNPDGTTTNSLSDGTTADPFQEQMETLRQQVTAGEQELANLASGKVEAQEGAGIFERMKELNEGKAKLRELEGKQTAFQDSVVDIPLQEKQRYRDAGVVGTKQDLQRATTQDIENAVLSAGAVGRQAREQRLDLQAQTDSINANLAIIDQKYNAKKAQLEFDVKQKNALYDTALKSYGDIITQRQKAALEAQKQIYNSEAQEKQAEDDIRLVLVEKLAEAGVSGSALQTALTGSFSDLVGLDLGVKALSFEDQLKQQEAQRGLVAMGTADRKNMASSKGLVDNIQSVLSFDSMFKGEGYNRGLNLIASSGGLDKLGKITLRKEGLEQKSGVLGKLDNLMNKETLEGLANAKAQGITFGALSEKEVALVADAMSILSSWAIRDEDTNKLLGFKASPKQIRDEITKIQTSYKRSFLEKKNSRDIDYINNLQFMPAEYIDSLYIDEIQQIENPQESIIPSGNTASFIKNEEGFRSGAYLDQVGKPTIGYGATAINGVPVRLGDTITEEQASSLFQKQLTDNHSNWKNKIKTKLTGNQKTALASFEYNLGGNIWNTTGKDIISAINRGDIVNATRIMKQHNKGRIRGKLEPIAGLTKRRQREANLMLS